MKILILAAIIVCVFSSCASVNPEPERKCEGGLCGTHYVEPEVSPELVAKFRSQGKRVPIYIPKLIYPEFLFYQKMEGKVLVAVDIDKYGNVVFARIACFEPNEAFNMNAIEYMQHWKFEASDTETKNQYQLVGFLKKQDTPSSFTKCSK